jgi:hypothetical protein
METTHLLAQQNILTNSQRFTIQFVVTGLSNTLSENKIACIEFCTRALPHYLSTVAGTTDNLLPADHQNVEGFIQQKQHKLYGCHFEHNGETIDDVLLQLSA